jgi:para-aminobenzoate synthetase/4-amino-4-deoxychorismate lyase
MQIIRELEKGDRGIYCGALGFISPGSKAVFNMPIRTISITNGNGQMGVGSGIVIDSDPKQEYRECILKADFLTRQHNSFKIIETMLWEGKYIFLSAHLKRLRECAEYFGFVCDLSVVTARLRRLEKSLKQGSRYRVRLLLDRNGKIGLNSSEIESSLARNGNFIAISRHRTDPDNLFLYHKTTNRALYDSQHKVYAAKGYLDVIFLNTRNEVTEGAISNIMIQKAGRLYTPVLDSGLLPGIFRQHLLDIGKAKEKKLTLIDLRKADKIFICNSVRGLVEVKLREG